MEATLANHVLVAVFLSLLTSEYMGKLIVRKKSEEVVFSLDIKR